MKIKFVPVASRRGDEYEGIRDRARRLLLGFVTNTHTWEFCKYKFIYCCSGWKSRAKASVRAKKNWNIFQDRSTCMKFLFIECCGQAAEKIVDLRNCKKKNFLLPFYFRLVCSSLYGNTIYIPQSHKNAFIDLFLKLLLNCDEKLRYWRILLMFFFCWKFKIFSQHSKKDNHSK